MSNPKTHKKKRVFRKNKKGVSRRMKYQMGGAPLTKEEIHKMVTGIYQQLGGNTAAGLGTTAVVYSYFAPAQARLATTAVTAAIRQFMSGFEGAAGQDISAFITGLGTTVPNALLSTYQVIYDALTRCPMATVAIGASVITGTVVHKYHAQIVEQLGQMRAQAGTVGGDIRDDPLYLLTYIISLLYCIQQEATSPVVAVAQFITRSSLSAAYQLSVVASSLARGTGNAATGLSSFASNTASSIRRSVVSGGQVLLGLLDTVSVMGPSCIMPAAAEFVLGPDEMDEMFGQIDPRLAAHIAASNILEAQQLINAEWIARVGSAPRLSRAAAADAAIEARRSIGVRDIQRNAVTNFATMRDNDRRTAGQSSEIPFNAPQTGTFSFGSPSVGAPSSSNNSRQLEEREIEGDKGGKSKKRRRSHKKRV